MIAYLLIGLGTAYFLATADKDVSSVDIIEAAVIMIAWPALLAALIMSKR